MAGKNRFTITIVSFTMLFGMLGPCFANPNLPVGVWTDITPSWASGKSMCDITIDPSHPSTLYILGTFGDVLGLIKTTDGGSNWSRVGNPPAITGRDSINYLDAPFQLAVDPANSQHLYVTQMSAGGSTWGFWISYDGGASWKEPRTFIDACNQVGEPNDPGHFEVDPTDFNHVLIAFHFAWNNAASGIFETKDGGKTFIIHYPTSGWSGGSRAICFLYDPAHGRTDLNTWLMNEDGTGIWRTSNAGTSWTKVANVYTAHGGSGSHVYTKSGMLYIGGAKGPFRSSDNGLTWESCGIDVYCYSVGYDGNKLYVGQYGGGGWFTSPENDGTHWTRYTGAGTGGGVTSFRYDSLNHIMYSANEHGGIWALRVAAQTEVIRGNNAQYINKSASGASNSNNNQTSTRFYSIQGRHISGPVTNRGTSIIIVKQEGGLSALAAVQR